MDRWNLLWYGLDNEPVATSYEGGGAAIEENCEYSNVEKVWS